ncbi:MAG TPA: hypothetical protein VL651_15880 [Bacteroidia bacterium]|nr:hypothetical protein [Bacteroidia bacterium]
MKNSRIRPGIILFSFMIIMSCFADAQNNFTRVAAGFNYAFPKLRHDYSTDPWKGVHIRNKFIELGYMAGKVKDPSEQEVLGYNAYIGGNFTLRKYAFGKREYGIKGYFVVPFIAGDIGLLSIGGQRCGMATFAPGISLQLPYTLIDFRLNVGLGFDNVHGLLRNQVFIAPTFAFQLDALWDVMDPHLKFDGHYEGVNEYTSYSDHVEYTDDYIITTTTATTTYSPYSYDSYRYDVGPHISIGPRVSYWNLKKGDHTLMTGIVQSGRAHGFGYDLIAEKGSITTQTGYDLKATRAMARLSFDIGLGKVGNTHFTRLMVGGGLGYNWFQKSDTHVHSDNGQFFNMFVSYEIGAVSFEYSVNKAFYNKFDDQKYFAFSYRLPIERLYDRYKQLRESR